MEPKSTLENKRCMILYLYTQADSSPAPRRVRGFQNQHRGRISSSRNGCVARIKETLQRACEPFLMNLLPVVSTTMRPKVRRNNRGSAVSEEIQLKYVKTQKHTFCIFFFLCLINSKGNEAMFAFFNITKQLPGRKSRRFLTQHIENVVLDMTVKNSSVAFLQKVIFYMPGTQKSSI